MKILCFLPQLFQSFPLDSATNYFEIFSSWLNTHAECTRWPQFELDEGGQFAGHWSSLIETISLVHEVFKVYPCNKGTSLVTYLLVENCVLPCCCMLRLWRSIHGFLLLAPVAFGFVAQLPCTGDLYSGSCSLHILHICGCTDSTSGAWFLRVSIAMLCWCLMYDYFSYAGILWLDLSCRSLLQPSDLHAHAADARF